MVKLSCELFDNAVTQLYITINNLIYAQLELFNFSCIVDSEPSVKTNLKHIGFFCTGHFFVVLNQYLVIRHSYIYS